MCGIAGKYDLYHKRSIDRDLISKMCSQIVHRGPDDEGIFVKDWIGLGMRRLSIIDIEGGRQPIFNEDETIIVVYNGETYNFKSLKESLLERGHIFTTATDTEVLVHAYEEYGVDFVERLRGMFAFALWDATRKRFILARDRMGKKPLYYFHHNGFLWFGSEIKSILVDPDVKRSVDLQALDYYLSFNYIPAPSTIFKDIKKLPPAAILVCENGKLQVNKYWTLNNLSNASTNEHECTERLYESLSEAVKIRLVSDVPLGAFLSGGIDSSIIVGLMAEHSTSPVKTFSIGFDDEDFSELEYAKIISEVFSTDHHEYVVTSDVQELIPRLIWHYTEPVGDSSAIPTYYVSKMTRQSVTVALSGDGGDELFAGYGKYPIIQDITSKNKLNSLLRTMITRVFLAQNLGFLPLQSIVPRIQRSLSYRLSTAKHRDFIWITHFDGFLKNHLYSPHLKRAIQKDLSSAYYQSRTSQSPDNDVLSQILYTDLTSYLPDDLLIKVDIASMANSLEVRCPFLDHEFVSLAVSIPNSLKLRNGESKYILKKAFAKVLPDRILKRKKMGFSIPIDRWFRTDLKEFSEEILLHDRRNVDSFFNRSFLKHLLDSHASGENNHGTLLWLLLNFVLWHRMFIEEITY